MDRSCGSTLFDGLRSSGGLHKLGSVFGIPVSEL